MRSYGANMKTPKWILQFWDKCIPEPNTGCWLWTGSMWGNGYGQVRANNKIRFAHRAAYELARGPIPKGDGYHGTCVLHRCDVRCCVNPDHLFLGTHKDNMDDMARKGRKVVARGDRNGMRTHPESIVKRFGEDHPGHKLTTEAVRKIRQDVANGESQRSVARRYGMDQSTVSGICRRKLWPMVD